MPAVVLPPKENAIFKQIAVRRSELFGCAVILLVGFTSRAVQKFYETKQYKKGLKAADLILKKFPEHGGKLRPLPPSP